MPRPSYTTSKPRFTDEHGERRYCSSGESCLDPLKPYPLVSSFTKSSRSADGLDRYCKLCKAYMNLKYIERNRQEKAQEKAQATEETIEKLILPYTRESTTKNNNNGNSNQIAEVEPEAEIEAETEAEIEAEIEAETLPFKLPFKLPEHSVLTKKSGKLWSLTVVARVFGVPYTKLYNEWRPQTITYGDMVCVNLTTIQKMWAKEEAERKRRALTPLPPRPEDQALQTVQRKIEEAKATTMNERPVYTPPAPSAKPLEYLLNVARRGLLNIFRGMNQGAVIFKDESTSRQFVKDLYESGALDQGLTKREDDDSNARL